MKTDNKDIKVKFDDKAESLVRRTLSDLEDSTRALSLWLENSLKEWELHDSMIFSFQVRVKSVESTIKKHKNYLKIMVLFLKVYKMSKII